MASSVRNTFRHPAIRSATEEFRRKPHCLSSRRHLSYKYSPLDETGQIRLLKLSPGSLGSPIKCEFLPVNLAKSVQNFDAISYAWGNPALKYKIECEQDELNVTESVRGLLDHIRDPNEDRVIWIDAICIDQQNFAERSQQVRLMRQIYSSAESVSIWLGPEKDESGLLQEFIPRLADVFWGSQRAQLFTDEVLFQKTKTHRTSREWVALKRLFERPWFNRTWIVQEFVSSPQHTFLCGKFHISAELLVLVAKELRHLHLNGNGFVRHHGFDFAAISKFLRMARIRKLRMSGEETDFSLLTYSFWSSEASDPKDKIFSMLGLDNGMAIRMEPDYRDSIQTVYTKATQQSLLNHNAIGILSLAGIGNDRALDNLPSWVPDFSATETPAPPFELFAYDGCIQDSWGSYNIHIFEETLSPFLFEGKEFTLDAINFDTIKRLGTMLNIENNENLKEWTHEAKSLFLTSNYYLSNEFPNWDVHWRSLIADRIYQYTLYIQAPQIYGNYYEALREQLEMKTKHKQRITHWQYTLESIGGAGRQITKEMRATRFVAALWQSAHGRRYCVTGKGDVALVPRYAAVGDEICKLAGCIVPFVVRSFPGTGSGKKLYELVGECYVHGIMRGSRQDLSLGEFNQITFI
jgi:hypothetical protein